MHIRMFVKREVIVLFKSQENIRLGSIIKYIRAGCTQQTQVDLISLCLFSTALFLCFRGIGASIIANPQITNVHRLMHLIA